ncbi:MAG: hypothetical protein WDO74_13375 [Pseudomonadota bacterium]
MRPSLGFLPFLLTALLSRAAAAEEAATVELAALDWVRLDSAASCPSEAEVTQAIEQRLGHAALVPKERAKLVIEAKLEGLAGGGFRVEIALVRGDAVVGRRELESEEPSCQGVAETAALVIALTIDPEASLEPLAIPTVPAAAPTAPTAAATPTAAAIERPSVAPAAPARQASWQADLELGGSIATGTVPNLAAGLYLRGRALPPALPLGIEVEGAYFPSKRVEALPGKGADFTAFYLGAGLCSRPRRASRLSASLCAGSEVGALAGQGYGFSSTPSFRTLTFALAARGVLWFRVLKPLAVVLGPSVAVPLKRDYFEIETAEGSEPLFRMSAIGFGFNLGAVWEL